MTRGTVVVVGDSLLDRDLDGHVERLAPDAPVPVVDQPVGSLRPGGAALAALLAADGRPVTLVTALGDDEAGRTVRRLLSDGGVQVADVGLNGRTPEKIRVQADGRPLLRMDYGDRRDAVGSLNTDARRALAAADTVLVSDYGRGMTAEPSVRDAVAAAAAAARTSVVWDPHPRGAQPVAGVRLATPNRAEAAGLTPDVQGDGLAAVTARARVLLERWFAAGVAVTLGARGALLVGGDGTPLAVPAPAVRGGDPCGAGDRFASAVATALADGAVPSEAVVDAVAAAAAFVAAGGAGAVRADTVADLAPTIQISGTASRTEALALVERTRAAGGTVVATGGCFDLLHAGHVAALQAARALGDCLVVCLNSDDSVRRLKGPDRPVVTADDRAAVLSGLACVDAVTVFSEDTPEALLDVLRPDVWAKGADYAVADLPEATLLATWGGQAVVLPYLAGRSTTSMIQEAVRRGS